MRENVSPTVEFVVFVVSSVDLFKCFLVSIFWDRMIRAQIVSITTSISPIDKNQSPLNIFRKNMLLSSPLSLIVLTYPQFFFMLQIRHFEILCYFTQKKLTTLFIVEFGIKKKSEILKI